NWICQSVSTDLRSLDGELIPRRACGECEDFGLRKILGKSDSPTGVKNPCLIVKVLSKRTGIDDDLIGFFSRFQPTFALSTGN
ncbi:hypothetical protein, partial [Microcoleus anatoxicus]|uniref:hypothetical protein n=1 Tax=Microcoleus anatoxicus TaxID=2705319 RepID=UPI0030C8EB7A